MSGADYEIKTVDFGQLEHRSDWYLEINPQGLIPSYKEGANIFVESAAILRYLGAKHQLTTLWPEDPVPRQKVDAALDFS
jgi:glutathione S-transferase